MTPSDPRTAPDDKQEAVEDVGSPDNHGISAPEPAEGANDDAQAGSAKG